MPSCSSIDALVTPYIDGEIPATDRQLVDEHIRVCAACRSRVDAEREVSRLLRERRSELCAPAAPESLRLRCRFLPAVDQVVPFAARAQARSWRQRLPRLAVAATVLLGLGGVATYRMTAGATQAIAAELTADHLKCFFLNGVLATHDTEAEAEAYLRSAFDWHAELPDNPHTADMELVGSRWCLYEHGKVAHVMYKHHGVPVSIFMLPGTSRERSLTRALGHDAVVWADGQRTFVLVAKAPRAEVQEVATFVQNTLR
jgi:anti-sigma factor RsiW